MGLFVLSLLSCYACAFSKALALHPAVSQVLVAGRGFLQALLSESKPTSGAGDRTQLQQASRDAHWIVEFLGEGEALFGKLLKRQVQCINICKIADLMQAPSTQRPLSFCTLFQCLHQKAYSFSAITAVMPEP